MYDTVDRSAVKAHQRRGLSANKIAELLGMDRKTVLKILKGSAEVEKQKRERASAVDAYAIQIRGWLSRGTPVKRMLELAREADPPYAGSRSEFYHQVAALRAEQKAKAQELFVRFDGLAGEYCQIDWGEVRDFKFTHQAAGTRYFFCARLKFSRMSFVRFTTDMRQETLIRCLLGAFEEFGGVPWVTVTDNMKTVTTGRDERGRPIWNPVWLKMMCELESHPEACWPASGNQKGAVENLVGWVKSNFLPERSFIDDADLAAQCRKWQERANGEVSAAHGGVPREVWLEHERSKLTPLQTSEAEYGLAMPVRSTNESLVHTDGNRYSVPVAYALQPLLARVRRDWIEFYAAEKLVARHQRVCGKQRHAVRVPEHYEALFKKKPRAQVMLYRDHLMLLDRSIQSYVEALCCRNRAKFGPCIKQMYELLQQYGAESLGAACAVASEHCCYGSDYLAALLQQPRSGPSQPSLVVPGVAVPQEAIDRALGVYGAYTQESGGHRSGS